MQPRPNRTPRNTARLAAKLSELHPEWKVVKDLGTPIALATNRIPYASSSEAVEWKAKLRAALEESGLNLDTMTVHGTAELINGSKTTLAKLAAALKKSGALVKLG